MLQEIADLNHKNIILKVYKDTLHEITWEKLKDDSECNLKVGCVLADLQLCSGDVLKSSPRFVATNMIERLESLHNLKLYSAFEPEYSAFRLDSVVLSPSISDDPNGEYPTPVPYTIGKDMFSTHLLKHYRKFFIDLDQHMSKIGIPLKDFSIENSDGQLESPLLPSYGIKAADNFFIFKQAAREIAENHNMFLTFMSVPLTKFTGNGNHFNHSLWSKDLSQNAFRDESDPDKLSQLARYWIGGLLEHLPSILVFASPTINCYRRLHKYFAPDLSNWAIDNRFASLRVKNFDAASTYIENRLVSAAACPYHVLAATLAAGMDGIERKIEPDQIPKPLPRTLAESIEFLEKDQTFIDIIGPEFVHWYVQVKKRADFVSLKDVDVTTMTDEDLALERREYFYFI